MNNNDIMTTLIDAMLYALEGEDPSKAIINSEKRAQQSVVRNQRLQKKIDDIYNLKEVIWNGIEDSMELEEKRKIMDHNNIEYTKQQYEKMGINIISWIYGDRIFVLWD